MMIKGKKWTGAALPITEGKVLERLPQGHGRSNYNRLHLDLLAFLFQFPHTSGVPLLDVTTVTDTGTVAVAVYSQIGSVSSNWPTVLVEGESCCVFQLLGLTQFPVVPRHPQSQNPKHINWGIERGLVVTYLYRRWAIAAAIGCSAGNPVLL